MVDITQIMRFDDLASNNSPIHNLEGRIKLISTIFIMMVLHITILMVLFWIVELYQL